MSWSARFQTSWELLKRSLHVLRSNPRLLLFPCLSALCTIALVLFFLAPVLILCVGLAASHGGDWQQLAAKMNVAFYGYGVVIYLVAMFVATFFNVAFYHEILRALSGDPVSLANGLRFALSRSRSILMWSLLAGTVGLLIRAIEDRLGWIGKIVMGFVGVVWSVAAVFAIPVIVRRDETNPLAVLRDSAATLKRTWGESLIGFVGIRLGGVIFILATLAFGLAGLIGIAVLHWPAVAIGAAVLWVLAIVAAGVLMAMASHVYRCALYVYASEGVVPAPYSADMMNAGWKIKRAK
jgi:hypothetical protein